MKKLYIIALFVSAAFVNNAFAQVDINMFKVDSWATSSAHAGMYITWETPLAASGDVFLVEKLNANWDYIEVGKVKYEESYKANSYRLIDNQPMEGENYYRITLVKKNTEPLVSELMIADYFQPTQPEFKYIFNDKFANYAALKHVGKMPKEIGIFGTSKYAQNTLKFRRIKSEQTFHLGEDAIDNKAMVATID